ncbi:MAG: hypothetical protein Q8L47_04700 [bacterium]|nr:hypothetical protein [bacterium]
MKHSAALLLVISFVGISVFSFALFDMGSNHPGSCIASVVDRAACQTNIANFATHHTSSLQTLIGNAIPSSSNWFLLLASLLLISVSIFLFYKILSISKQELLPQRLLDQTLDFLCSQQKIISWLSLLELSPAPQ